MAQRRRPRTKDSAVASYFDVIYAAWDRLLLLKIFVQQPLYILSLFFFFAFRPSFLPAKPQWRNQSSSTPPFLLLILVCCNFILVALSSLRRPLFLLPFPIFFFNFALSFWFRVFQDFFVFGFVFLAYLYDLVLNFEPKTLNPYST